MVDLSLLYPISAQSSHVFLPTRNSSASWPLLKREPVIVGLWCPYALTTPCEVMQLQRSCLSGWHILFPGSHGSVRSAMFYVLKGSCLFSLLGVVFYLGQVSTEVVILCSIITFNCQFCLFYQLSEELW